MFSLISPRWLRLSIPSVVAVCSLGVVAIVASSAKPQDTSAQPKGEQVYMQARCFACHGQFGFGGVGPRFRQDRFLGLTDYVIAQILAGRDIMPPFESTLDNRQVAAVASYIRQSWGNSFGAVQANEVAAVRNSLKNAPQAQNPPQPATTGASTGQTQSPTPPQQGKESAPSPSGK